MNSWAVDPKDHRLALESAWKEFEKKKTALRDAELALNTKKTELELTKKNLEDAKKSRSTDILEKLN